MEKSSRTQTNLPDCESETLAKFKLFARFHREELRTLLSLCACQKFTSGQTIVREGEAGESMYLILRGAARITLGSHDLEVELSILGEGDFFGEVALVDDGPRSASVTATEDCELLEITRADVNVLAGVKPGAAIHLLTAIGRSLVTRLRAGNQRYLDLILSGPVDQPAD